jgi:hypothetical protein
MIKMNSKNTLANGIFQPFKIISEFKPSGDQPKALRMEIMSKYY